MNDRCYMMKLPSSRGLDDAKVEISIASCVSQKFVSYIECL